MFAGYPGFDGPADCGGSHVGGIHGLSKQSRSFGADKSARTHCSGALASGGLTIFVGREDEFSLRGGSQVRFRSHAMPDGIVRTPGGLRGSGPIRARMAVLSSPQPENPGPECGESHENPAAPLGPGRPPRPAPRPRARDGFGSARPTARLAAPATTGYSPVAGDARSGRPEVSLFRPFSAGPVRPPCGAVHQT